MIRAQVGSAHVSVMVAVLSKPCVIRPHNSAVKSMGSPPIGHSFTNMTSLTTFYYPEFCRCLVSLTAVTVTLFAVLLLI
jgi:hypothetical protein